MATEFTGHQPVECVIGCVIRHSISSSAIGLARNGRTVLEELGMFMAENSLLFLLFRRCTVEFVF